MDTSNQTAPASIAVWTHHIITPCTNAHASVNVLVSVSVSLPYQYSDSHPSCKARLKSYCDSSENSINGKLDSDRQEAWLGMQFTLKHDSCKFLVHGNACLNIIGVVPYST